MQTRRLDTGTKREAMTSFISRETLRNSPLSKMNEKRMEEGQMKSDETQTAFQIWGNLCDPALFIWDRSLIFGFREKRDFAHLAV